MATFHKPGVQHSASLRQDAPGRAQAEELLKQALALHQAGNFGDAEMLYRIILASDPTYAEALTLLGTLRLQTGKVEEGARLLEDSVRLRPQQPVAWNNLGNAFKELHRFEAALDSYGQAIATQPDYPDAHFNRGILLHGMKQFEAALEAYGQALAANPGFVEAYSNRGAVCRDLLRYEEALACYDQAVALSPGNAEAYNNRGTMLLDMGRSEEALASYDRAIALSPAYAAAHCNRGNALRKLGRSEEALESYRQAITIVPTYADAWYCLGCLLADLGRHAEACEAYEKTLVLNPGKAEALHNLYISRDALGEPQQHEEILAAYDRMIALSPDSVGTYYGRSNLLEALGKTEQACLDLYEVLRLDPRYAAAYQNLAYMNALDRDAGVLERFNSLYAERSGCSWGDRASLCFAMGRLMENQRRYDEAFAAYDEGNRIFSEKCPCDEVADEKQFQDMMAGFTRERIETLDRSVQLSPDGRVPVFIVGMPRSGTTLLEQILSSHSGLFGAGELPVMADIAMGKDLPKADDPCAGEMLQAMRQGYLERVWKLAPQAQFISDKRPANFLLVGWIHLMFPEARIIHAMRDPMDSCFSCFSLKFHGDSHRYTYDLGVLGRYYRRYTRLMQHWREVLPPGRILDVRYEDMVADTEREARRVLDYLGLPWDPSCLKFHESKRAVNTASVSQVRKPIYSTSVARWKRFEKHLAPLLEIVGDLRQGNG